MQEYIQAIIAMIAVINPAISGMIHLELTKKLSNHDRIKEATKSALQIFLILLGVALVGKYFLKTFGISIETFRIVGGIVIAYIGFTMLSGKIESKDHLKGKKAKKTDIDNSPLIMFSASPGTIATLITLSLEGPACIISNVVLVAVSVSMLITYLTLVIMSIFPHKESKIHSFITQFMGLILIAMGLQFALEGIKTFFGI